MNESLNSLWDFALALYHKPGAEQICLRLQDECAANINLILWCQWLQSQRVVLTPELLSEAKDCVTAWDSEVVKPLRAARRSAKGLITPAQQTFYNELNDIELRAEQHEYQLLVAIDLSKQPRCEAEEREANLLLYLRSLELKHIEPQWLDVLTG